jgi:hypothetical protein
VWAAKKQGQPLVNQIKLQSKFAHGDVTIADQYNSKTSVILCGAGAHEAALRLLPLRGPVAPWNNISENNRDWVCPRVPCVDKQINIRASQNCQHCGEAKPRNLSDSLAVWKESLARSDENAKSETNHPSDTVQTTVEPRAKRQRVSECTDIDLLPGTNLSSHPHANDERVRVSLRDVVPSYDDDALLSKLGEVLSPCFGGKVVMRERFGTKAAIELKGMGAHQALVFLEALPHGPSHAVPWHRCTLHHREWICPMISCVRVDFNIDYCDPTKPGKCKNCNRPRPKDVRESAAIWHEQLEKTTMSMMHSLEGGGSTSEIPPRSVSPSYTPSSCPMSEPFGDETYYHKEPQATISRPDGEFGVWFDAKLAAGYTPKEILCDNKISTSRFKAPIKGLLSCSSHSRMWAFDIKPTSGAKGWAWTECVHTFVDVYEKIHPHGRHAYEVIEGGKPCRMVYDLDMRTDNGLNARKDDSKMANNIGKCAEEPTPEKEEIVCSRDSSNQQ